MSGGSWARGRRRQQDCGGHRANTIGIWPRPEHVRSWPQFSTKRGDLLAPSSPAVPYSSHIRAVEPYLKFDVARRRSARWASVTHGHRCDTGTVQAVFRTVSRRSSPVTRVPPSGFDTFGGALTTALNFAPECVEEEREDATQAKDLASESDTRRRFNRSAISFEL